MAASRTYEFNTLLTRAFVCMIGEALASDVTFAERPGWKANDVVVILHVDDVGMSHSSNLGTLFARTDYFERFAKVGMEKQIPVLCVGGHMTYVLQENKEAAPQLRPWVKKLWNAGLPVLDDLFTGFTSFKAEEKQGKLMTLLAELKPGVTEILFHASLPTEEFPLITGSSEARRADLKPLTNPRVKQLIQERGIILTTWKELKERRKKASAIE